MHEEKHHFTCKRCIYTLIAFSVLFTTTYFDKKVTGTQWYTLVVAFVVSMVLLTVYAVNDLKRVSEIKKRDGYKYDKQDLQFDTKGKIVYMSLVCGFAAVLCGLTGAPSGSSSVYI